jgi:hypothetical protein
MLALLTIFLMSASTAAAPVEDELGDMLARAEALYYEADFAKSIELFLQADELLRRQPRQLQERTAVKLHLALGYIGLNDSDRAKVHLRELYSLDSEHHIDAQMYSPKVLQLAREAKAEQSELRCRSLLDEGQQELGNGNSAAVARLIASNQARCSSLASLSARAAELFYKQGLEAYRKTKIEDAQQSFRAALNLEPEHELAAQYLDLTSSRLEIASDRALLAWRKDFSAGEFTLAARSYRELKALSSSDAMEEMQTEYRRALFGLVDSWKKACAGNDTTTMEQIRLKVESFLPEPSFGEDILATMTTCTPTGCIPMSTPLALARLKSRVDPQFPANVLTQLRTTSTTVHVKARINENGDVASSEVVGGNPQVNIAVRTAFDRWKFSPAVVQGAPRCVDTEIPIVINLTN